MHLKRIARLLPLLTIGSLLAFAAIGCFDSSDDPTGTDTGNDFSETTVLTIGAPTAVLQNEQTINGVIAAVNGFSLARNYVWNESEQAYIEDLGPYGDNWTGSVWVQYLDDGTPVQDKELADSIHIVMDLTILYSGEGPAVELIIDSDITVTGLGTGTLVAEGSGGYTYDSLVNYSATWETVGPDHVQIPEGGGCPTGEIEYTMAPYTMNIIYDGSPTASYTVYDGGGSAVDDGTGNIYLLCSLF